MIDRAENIRSRRMRELGAELPETETVEKLFNLVLDIFEKDINRTRITLKHDEDGRLIVGGRMTEFPCDGWLVRKLVERFNKELLYHAECEREGSIVATIAMCIAGTC